MNIADIARRSAYTQLVFRYIVDKPFRIRVCEVFIEMLNEIFDRVIYYSSYIQRPLVNWLNDT